MTAQVAFQRISVRAFRNLCQLDFEPAARLNVIVGDNGQGKTSLLEALYLVASSRSFRTDRLAEVVQDSAEQATVRATIAEDGQPHEQRAIVQRSSRTVLLDGKRPSRLSAYATRTPVVVFHPGDLLLVTGPAGMRRTLLDRIALFGDPASGDDRRRYLRAARQRQRVLEERGADAPELAAFERLMAEHGARLTQAHAAAARRLVDALRPAFEQIAPDGLSLQARYIPAGCEELDAFERQLAARRHADLRRRGASFGPHRDEFELSLAGRSARRHASQGQQRILTLALKVAELACVRHSRGAHPVLLLDDVSSELDSTRVGAIHNFVHATSGQVFITTTRPGLLAADQVAAAERTDWQVNEGRIRPLRPGSIR